MAFSLMRMPRATLSHMIAFLTGHNFLKRHEAIIFDAETQYYDLDFEPADRSCDFCGNGGDQTTLHLMTECDKFARLRLECFGTASPEPPFMMAFSQVVAFLKLAKIESLEIYQTQKEYQETLMSSDSADNQSGSEQD